MNWKRVFAVVGALFFAGLTLFETFKTYPSWLLVLVGVMGFTLCVVYVWDFMEDDVIDDDEKY